MKTIHTFSTNPFFLAALLLLAAIPAPALAASVFGASFREMRPGFGALSNKGISGGETDARRFGEDCNGWIDTIPNHLIWVDSPVKMTLRAGLTSDSAPITLVVRITEGRAWCVGTSDDGSRPTLSAEFPVGRYEVYVGSVDKKQSGSYTLRLREDKDWHPRYEGEGYRDDARGSGNFKRLQPGFNVRRSPALGFIERKVDTRHFGNGCVGWISDKPNHIMSVRSPVKMTLRAFRGYSLYDPTLLVKTPDGRVLCDDNSHDGINPEISGEFAEGTYEIFVGSLKKGQFRGYYLIVSEDGDAPPSADTGHADNDDDN